MYISTEFSSKIAPSSVVHAMVVGTRACGVNEGKYKTMKSQIVFETS